MLREQLKEIQSEWGEGIHDRRYIGSESRERVFREQFKEIQSE